MNVPTFVDEPRLQQVRKLTEVCRAITYAASLDEVFQLTVDHAAQLLAADTTLLLVTNDHGVLAVRASHGVDPVLAGGYSAPLTEALVPRLAELLGAPPDRLLGVPLVVAGAIRGILVAMRRRTTVETTDDEWLLSALADQAAVALEKTRLDEVGEFRELLIGIVGHDLRNPLSTILMGAQLLLQREGLGEKETQIVRKMRNSASVASRMIDQLLDLTRSRLGRGIPVDAAPLDLNDVIQQLIGETELTHPDRPLRVESSGDLTGTWDSDRIHQLLGNLVGNAVQHGEPRSPIELRIEGGAAEVSIEVANRGCPIPPAAMPFVFEAFRQGRAARRPRSRGLGLGLFIAQEIARAHGGSISVTSSEREGTKFVVLLPRGSAA